MIYFHNSSCIHPQKSEGESLTLSDENRLLAQEPSYENIPRGVLRRMGKAVRIGVGAALPILDGQGDICGIVIGTGNGGMEDCIRFLNQILEYNEGQLTPTNFVQSTTNAIAGQIGLMNSNTAYNATHVHRGLAFENALVDASFIAKENPQQRILVGGVDEISAYNYNIDFLAGWYKKEACSNNELYRNEASGSIAGEGAAMFLASSVAQGAAMKLEKVYTTHSSNENDLKSVFDKIKKEYSIGSILTGENGDSRLTHFYEACEGEFSEASVWRYKHLCGEYPTTTSFALWLSLQACENGEVTAMVDVKRGNRTINGSILIYNAYHGKQHGFMVVRAL